MLQNSVEKKLAVTENRTVSTTACKSTQGRDGFLTAVKSGQLGIPTSFVVVLRRSESSEAEDEMIWIKCSGYRMDWKDEMMCGHVWISWKAKCVVFREWWSAGQWAQKVLCRRTFGIQMRASSPLAPEPAGTGRVIESGQNLISISLLLFRFHWLLYSSMHDCLQRSDSSELGTALSSCLLACPCLAAEVCKRPIRFRTQMSQISQMWLSGSNVHVCNASLPHSPATPGGLCSEFSSKLNWLDWMRPSV